MERTTTLGGNLTAASHNSNPITARLDGAAEVAHRTTDKIADQANAHVDRSADAVHRAVDSAADTATSAAEWASSVSEQARQVQTRLTESASASIRARPIATVAGAIVVGYLLGRLARR
jgi:ElaB/YqjD/DUF883 family membrane-anchored ribosome-binding protein